MTKYFRKSAALAVIAVVLTLGLEGNAFAIGGGTNPTPPMSMSVSIRTVLEIALSLLGV
jgi:hypothetical protein